MHFTTKQSTLQLLLAVPGALALAQPNAGSSDHAVLSSHVLREFDENYEDIVCRPFVQERDGALPPCVSIEVIETICFPNGTEPLALEANRQCMCTGSYFAEWPYCLDCLFVHGLRSEREVAFYMSAFTTASSAFCGTPTPSAMFADIFSSAVEAQPSPTTGATVSSDQAVSKTAITLYLTSSISQGAGQITGEATGATATRRPIPTEDSSAPDVSETGSSGGDGNRSGGGDAGSETSGGASPSSSPSSTPDSSAWAHMPSNFMVFAVACIMTGMAAF